MKWLCPKTSFIHFFLLFVSQTCTFYSNKKSQRYLIKRSLSRRYSSDKAKSFNFLKNSESLDCFSSIKVAGVLEEQRRGARAETAGSSNRSRDEIDTEAGAQVMRSANCKHHASGGRPRAVIPNTRYVKTNYSMYITVSFMFTSSIYLSI